jgi:hypothetical protein
MQLFKKLGGRLLFRSWRNRSAELPKYNLVQLFQRDGYTYYRFPKETSLPLERFSMSMGLLERLSSGLSGGEMEQILSEMEKALAAGLSNPKNAAIMATYIHIIRERQSTVIHRDLLLNIAATWVVRSDENPALINPDIHKQKLEVFEAMAGEGSHDFFTRLDIEPLKPLLTISPSDLTVLWEYNLTQIQKLNEALTLLTIHREGGQRKRKTV